MLAPENAPFSYVPKYGGFDAMQIARNGSGNEAVDAVGGWVIIDDEVFVFANASTAPPSPKVSDRNWQSQFGKHGTEPPYAVAGGPFNTRCFIRVPRGSLVPAGQGCRRKPLKKTNPSASYLRGIDVSHYQGKVDWTKVAASGITFACAKATEGTTYVDDTFATNWGGMHKAGLIRCAYHFARPGDSPVDQAQHFVKTVNQAGATMPQKHCS